MEAMVEARPHPSRGQAQGQPQDTARHLHGWRLARPVRPAFRRAHPVTRIGASRRPTHVRGIRRHALVDRLPDGREPAVSVSGAEGMTPRSRSPRLQALVLCAMLLAVTSVRGNGPTEPPQTQNLDYQAGLEAIQASDWDRAIHDLNVAAVALTQYACHADWPC